MQMGFVIKCARFTNICAVYLINIVLVALLYRDVCLHFLVSVAAIIKSKIIYINCICLFYFI